MAGPGERMYKIIGGVTPCPGGWLVLPGRLSGVTVVAEEAFVVRTLLEVLDYRPKFDFGAINIPFGYPAKPAGPFRQAELEARELVRWPRAITIRPVPSRAALFASSRDEALKLEPWLTHNDLRNFPKMREAAEHIQPFHSRSFYSANADLSFQHMNGDVPLKTSPWHEDGRTERLGLIRSKLPSIDEVVSRVPPDGAHQKHVFDGAAMLWTARRASGRAIARLPLDPEWDDAGIRMELTR